MERIIEYSNILVEFLNSHGVSLPIATGIKILLFIILLFGVALLSDFITNQVLFRFLSGITKRTKTQWDDFLLDRKLFRRLSHIVPAVILYHLIPALIPELTKLGNLVRDVTAIYIILTIIRSLDTSLNILYRIFQHYEIGSAKPIKGYIQILQVLVYFTAIIIIISIIINQNPINLFLGLGAFAAVLVLIFKDTIMGFIGSVQLSANDMVRQGDWITMGKYGADGIVTEITLTTVKIKNFDRTITTIPTYSLVSDAFQNWRGMEESGVRRIKRSINIDMTSVKFCSDDMLDRFSKVQLINTYVESKQKEIEAFNKANKVDTSILVNGRRQTNLGIFRVYMQEYLRNHPRIDKDATLMVRHLQSTDSGMPLEIYAFTPYQEWEQYEALIADLFDHVLAVVPQFELRIFQSPTGQDWSSGLQRNN
jgi:miniconductance mechanosensitive channel